MPRILFVTQYYPPEAGAAANRISDIATHMVQLGHEVTVLTNLPNYPTGVVPPEYRDKARREEVIDGVRVVRVRSVIRPNSGFVTRITGMLSFGVIAGVAGARHIGPQDVIVAISPPLFTSIAGRRLAKKKHAPLVFNTADLWPESAVRLGALRNPLFIWLAERLEWSTYRRARTVWVVTEGQRETLLHRGLPASKILTLRTGANLSLFGRLEKASARSAVGWDDGFYVLHAGTLGLTMSGASLIDAADLLRGFPDIHFILAGDGAERPHLEHEARRRELNNVTFLGVQSQERVATLLSACDASLVNLRNLSFFEGTLPMKMYEAMASGRPLLLAADGLARKLAIDEAHAGIYVEPGNPHALARAVLYLRNHPEEGRKLGAQGRAYASSQLNRDAMIEQLSAHLRSLAGRDESHQIKPSDQQALSGRQA
jgi:glycosyltransferase involved in cell wall biosynthesis